MIKEIMNWYESLTQDSLNSLDRFYTEDSFFKDPFNEIKGREKIKLIFEHMFENTQSPKFSFIDMVESRGQAFLTWDFTFRIKNKEIKIHGSTHLKLNSDGKIYYHRDYWDVGEEVISKIPIVKNLYNVFITKFKV